MEGPQYTQFGFRCMTGSRYSQIQSRTAHYEAVGQILLGMPPEVFF